MEPVSTKTYLKLIQKYNIYLIKLDISKQGQKLLNSLVLLVENIRQPDVLKPVLKDLGARHKGYGTLPEYYPAVGEALLTTFA